MNSLKITLTVLLISVTLVSSAQKNKTAKSGSIEGKWNKTTSMGGCVMTIVSNSIEIKIKDMTIMGNFTISKDTIKVSDARCTFNPGIYIITNINNKLSFKLLSDDCSGRNEILPGESWVKSK